jgi:hypothetical protein
MITAMHQDQTRYGTTFMTVGPRAHVLALSTPNLISDFEWQGVHRA